MKLYSPDAKGKYVWQVADSKTRQVSFSVTTTRTAPPDACYGHPIGKYDEQGAFMTFCTRTHLLNVTRQTGSGYGVRSKKQKGQSPKAPPLRSQRPSSYTLSKA